MIVSWLLFIAVGLIIYAGFLKLAARLLRYSVSWKSSFLFAGIMLVAVIVDHVLVFREPVATRIGHGVMLAVGLVILGSWFFSGRGTNRQGAVLGWSGGHTTDGAGVCNDDRCGVRDRSSSSGFSRQASSPAAVTTR
jgi:hypothetical protein